MSLPTYGQCLQSNLGNTTSTTTAGSAGLPFLNPVTAGSLLIAGMSYNSGAGGLPVITDTLQNVWYPLPVYRADSTTTQLWYCPQSKGGINSVLASNNQLVIAEYFGGGIFLNQATLDGTSAGAGTGQTAVAIPTVNLTPFFEWDRASAFQGALAQSQIQQPGILLVGHFKATALLTTAVAGITNRQTSGSVFAFGDSGPTLLSAAAAPAQNVGWNFSGVSTWDLVAAAFAVPALAGHPL